MYFFIGTLKIERGKGKIETAKNITFFIVLGFCLSVCFYFVSQQSKIMCMFFYTNYH